VPSLSEAGIAERVELAEETCVLDGQHFFVRAQLSLPIQGSDEVFAWTVWVTQSEASFRRIVERWHEPDRVNDPPTFGYLSAILPYQPSTLNLNARLHQRAVGLRPLVELEPTDHPLAVEQREGITWARVQALAEDLLHPESADQRR
jgi:hypothetical protein